MGLGDLLDDDEGAGGEGGGGAGGEALKESVDALAAAHDVDAETIENWEGIFKVRSVEEVYVVARMREREREREREK